VAALAAFIKPRLVTPGALDEGDYEYLHETYGPDKFNLSDRGYIAQIHPLELWLVAYLRAHPQAGWDEIVKASARERVEVYDWLFSTSRKNAQDNRILSLLEIEAFQEIHKRWRKLGYPFSSLVPSYASAIGSSADRPAALAELMGVILNDGVKLPPVSLTRLEFAADTPYHTRFKRLKPQGERLFPAEVALVLKTALVNVVQEGTARRLRDAFATADGSHLVIGGKTGTGDHRKEVYAANGTVLESKVMNRVATFAFFMGQRYFGVMTVFVPGEAAGDYHFTSGLAVQILKVIEPALRPLVIGKEATEPDWEELARRFEAENPPPAMAPNPPAAPAEAAPAPDAAAKATADKPGEGKTGVETPTAAKVTVNATGTGKAAAQNGANTRSGTGKTEPAKPAAPSKPAPAKPAPAKPPTPAPTPMPKPSNGTPPQGVPPPAGPAAPSQEPAPPQPPSAQPEPPPPPAAPARKPVNPWPSVPGEGFQFPPPRP
jgi:membrane peptidoglycan carboxypeptidase